jgi:putative hydrolase of the HAD superfamily
MSELGRAFLAEAVPSPSESLVREFVETYVAEWSKGVRYHDALPDLLARLSRRFELAVITNTHDPDLVPGHLERMGVLGHFGQVVTSVEVGRRKPSPEIFRYALELLEAEPSRCIYVGDSYPADYLGARSVEMRGLLIDPDAQAPIAAADRLDTILQLEAALEAEGDTAA